MAVTDAEQLIGYLSHYLRAPATASIDAEGVITTTFDPPLSASEQVTYDSMIQTLSTPDVMRPEIFEAIKPDLAVMRTFRQQTQASFLALTQNQRDRALFDVINAQTNVLRAILKR